MKICLIVIGKTDASFVKDGIAEYEKRMGRYLPYEMRVLPDVRMGKMTEELQKNKEGEEILDSLSSGDYVVLLDEKGKEFSSVGFSEYISKFMQNAVKRLVFVIGGPYGFSESVYKRADDKVSLSKMTFSHQMVRMIFVEQLYRAMTILKGEPYHHV